MPAPRLIFFNQDLYDLGLVSEIPDQTERKTFNRDSLICGTFDFECKNIDEIFSIGNNRSFLFKEDWLYSSIQYYNSDGILTWDGIVTNIRNNHREKITTIETRDVLFKNRDTYIEYESSDWETPADAAKNIMDLYDLTNYNSGEINKSISYLTDNSVYIKCHFNKSDNTTVFSALESLGTYGGADVYTHLNEVYYVVWKGQISNVNLTLNTNRTNRIRSAPIVNYLEDQMVNDYEIGYDGDLGIPATDSDNNNIGANSRTLYGTKSMEPIDSSENAKIIYKDKTSAVWIGEQMIRRTHYGLTSDVRPLIKIQFDIDIEFNQYVTLTSQLKLTFEDEGWNEKIFEIYEFRRNEDSRNINIVAYEVSP